MKPHCRRPLAACLGAALCALRAPGLAGPPRPPPPQHPEGKGIGRPAGVGGRSPGLPLTSASSCSGKQLLGLSGGQVGKGHPGARSQTAGQGGHLSLTPQHYPGTSLSLPPRLPQPTEPPDCRFQESGQAQGLQSGRKQPSSGWPSYPVGVPSSAPPPVSCHKQSGAMQVTLSQLRSRLRTTPLGKLRVQGPFCKG